MNICHSLRALRSHINYAGLDKDFQKRISIGITMREGLQLTNPLWFSDEPQQRIVAEYMGFRLHLIPEPRQPIVDPSMS